MKIDVYTDTEYRKKETNQKDNESRNNKQIHMNNEEQKTNSENENNQETNFPDDKRKVDQTKNIVPETIERKELIELIKDMIKEARKEIN